jgi:4-hydroxybenzoate polyprenyltransferase
MVDGPVRLVVSGQGDDSVKTFDGGGSMADARPMNPAGRYTSRQIARGYLVLPHAMPVVVVMIATAAFALIAADGWPGIGPMARLLGAMLGGQLAIGAVNELVDAELDAVAKPGKPIPAGLVSRRGAGAMVGGGLAMMTVLGLTFGHGPFLLLIVGTGAGIAYSLWFKRTIWSWLPYLVALPLLPIWVWAALGEVEAGLVAIYPIGAAAVIAIQIAQSLPDVEADRATGVRTLAVTLGSRTARRTCWGAMLLAAALASALAPWLSDHPARVWVATAVVVGLVGLNVVIRLHDERRGVLACFPCIAAAAVVLGIGWTAALVAG